MAAFFQNFFFTWFWCSKYFLLIFMVAAPLGNNSCQQKIYVFVQCVLILLDIFNSVSVAFYL